MYLLVATIPALLANVHGMDGTLAATRYHSIVAEYDQRLKEYQQAHRAARTQEEHIRIDKEKYPFPGKYCQALLRVARENPRDPVAVDCLVWVVEHAFGPEKPQAIAQLARDYAQDPKLAPIVDRLAFVPGKATEELLHKLYEGSPDRNTRGKACFGLAYFLKTKAESMQAESPSKNTDPDKVLEEAVTFCQRAAQQFPDVKYFEQKNLGEVAEGLLFELRHLEIGHTAPDIAGEDIDGQKFRLGDYRGKVILLDFWATWCGPCRAEFPHYQSLLSKYAGRPFVVLGVDSDESRDDAKTLMKKQSRSWRSWFDDGKIEGPIAKRWNIQGRPTVYLLDHRGVIQDKSLQAKDMDALIEKLVGAAEKPAGR